MLKVFGVFTLMILAGNCFSLTTQKECRELMSFFEKDNSAITEKIKVYDARRKADAKDIYAEYAEGLLYCALAVKEPPVKDASFKARDHLEAFIKKIKDEPLAEVYYGMALSLTGRDDINPVGKMLGVQNGLDVMDHAVKIGEKDDQYHYIRYLRGNVCSSLPDFFKREKTAVDDFRFLEESFSKDTNSVVPALMIGVYYYLGNEEKTKEKE